MKRERIINLESIVSRLGLIIGLARISGSGSLVQPMDRRGKKRKKKYHFLIIAWI